MEILAINKVLGSFRKDDYPFLYQNWPTLLSTGISLAEINKHGGKKAMFEAIAKKFRKKKPSKEILMDLDLLYNQRYSSRKTWNVFKFIPVPGKTKRNYSSPDQFEEAIADHMSLYFNGDVHVKAFSESYWVRISIQQPKGKSGKISTTVTYVVYPKNSEYLLCANLMVAHTDYIMQVFLLVLKGHKMEAIHLSGRHLSSLLQLVVNKHSQGKEHEVAPTRVEQRFPDEIQNENRAQKRKREEFVDTNFGPRKMPKLEKVEYKLETKFKGEAYCPAMATHHGTFHCRVKFEGPSVIEGIKNLAEAGLAEVPMKGHLGKVHLLARNKFVLRSLRT